MGSSSMSQTNWGSYIDNTVRSKATVDQIYTSRNMKDSLNPKGINRESRDSDANPNSCPIIVGLDVTGSMSDILNYMARDGLETLVKEIIKRKPVPDPHMMYMGIGDGYCDSAPLQVTQFETDEKLVDQLREIWLEECGGGNNSEGYSLAWYFANFHTQTDQFEKRKKKGFLFTIGDDGPTPAVELDHIKRIFGDPAEEGIDSKTLLKMVSEKYHVFHINLSNRRSSWNNGTKIQDRWKELLGERAIDLKDHTKAAELIISLIQTTSGVDKDQVINSWDNSTSMIIKDSLNGLSNVKEENDVVVF